MLAWGDSAPQRWEEGGEDEALACRLSTPMNYSGLQVRSAGKGAKKVFRLPARSCRRIYGQDFATG